VQQREKLLRAAKPSNFIFYRIILLCLQIYIRLCFIFLFLSFFSSNILEKYSNFAYVKAGLYYFGVVLFEVLCAQKHRIKNSRSSFATWPTGPENALREVWAYKRTRTPGRRKSKINPKCVGVLI
jgi:hypothetical protein